MREVKIFSVLFLFFGTLYGQQNIAPKNLFVLTAAERALFTPSAAYLPIGDNWHGYEGPSLQGFWEAFDGDTLPKPLAPTVDPGGWFDLNGGGSQNHAMLWMGESALAYALQGNAAQYEIAARHCICLLDTLDFVQGHMRHEAIGLYAGFWEGGAAAMALAGLYAPAGSTSGPHLLASARQWWANHVSILRRLRMPDGQIMRVGARMNHGGPGDDDDENLSCAVNMQIIDPQPYSTLHPGIAARITADGLPKNTAVGYNPVTWNEPRAVAERWMVLRAFQAGAILRVPANQPASFIIDDIYKWTVGNKTYVATPSVTGFHHCRWEVSWQAGQYVHIEVSDSLSVPHGGGKGPWTPDLPQKVIIPGSAQKILGPVFSTSNPSCAQTNSCGNDAEIVSIAKPYRYGCETSIAPQVVIKNNGTVPITELAVYCQVDNNTLYSTYSKGAVKSKRFTLAGAGLASGKATTLTLDASTVSVGTHTVTAWMMDVNKITDVNAANNSEAMTFTVVTAGHPLAFTENFESTAAGQIPNEWSLNDPDANAKWFVYATATNKAAAFNNFAYTGAQNAKDELVMPDLDLSGSSSAFLGFDLAHASRPNAAKFDSLQVLVSTDCGTTFTSVWGKGGASLNTAADDSVIFIPAGIQDYKHIQIDLSAYASSSKTIIKFVNWSNNGNSTLVDNVNITSSVTAVPENNSSVGLNVFPVPAKDMFTVEFSLYQSSALRLQLLNTLGQVVYAENIPVHTAGIFSAGVNVSNFPAGIYQVVVSGINGISQKKVLVVK